MEASAQLDRILSIAMTVAMVAAAGVMVERRVNSPASARAIATYTYVSSWQASLAKAGAPLNGADRPVSIAIFTDFQCPFCRQLDSIASTLDTKYPGKLRQIIVHFPLPFHAQAEAAATAFECAARQGRSAAMSSILFAAQPSLSAAKWPGLATSAGVPDTAEHRQCMTRVDSRDRITAGLELGRKLAVTGTPTVMINGWLLNPTDPEQFMKAVGRAVAGKSPKP